MSDQHTPGPWQVSGVREKWRTSYSDHLMDSHVVGPDDAKGWVALIPYDPRNHAEDLANARLIAAAPELLDVVKAFVATSDLAMLVESDHPHAEYADVLRAALEVVAKAEGRS